MAEGSASEALLLRRVNKVRVSTNKTKGADAMDELPTRRWPNLLLLGNPKSGSTFFFSCLRAGPFDPNLLHGPHASSWQSGAYMLTTLGTKKEFNYWGGPGHSWGTDWYAGVPAPLSAWEWTGGIIEGRRSRRGENGNGEPSTIVESLCRLNSSAPLPRGRRRGRKACGRFPLECVEGTPIVRPGCALVRPFPARRHCGKANQPACELPKVRMSHAWPPASELSSQAYTIDPSINTFMSAPNAPDQLRAFAGAEAAGRLRFVVLLREPLARAQSSARMMREWHWDKSPNISAALLTDLGRLHACVAPIAPSQAGGALDLDGAKGFENSKQSVWVRAAAELPRLPDRQLGRLRACIARGHPLNHVRASIYVAGVLGWMSAGFALTQFLWLDTESMRSMGATRLLSTFAAFAGLPTHHLDSLPADIRAACESAARRAPASGRRLGAAVDDRMTVHAHRALPAEVAAQLREALTPFNELLKTLLADVESAATLRAVSWL